MFNSQIAGPTFRLWGGLRAYVYYMYYMCICVAAVAGVAHVVLRMEERIVCEAFVARIKAGRGANYHYLL